MQLSSEQMQAVYAGTGGKISWEEVPLPTGNIEVPDWVKDVHVKWMFGYANNPTFLLKTTCDIGDWPNQRFRKEGKGLYIAESGDGRAVAHYHDGAIASHEWQGKKADVTTKQEGYGGRAFELTMEDGSTRILRGPWHGSPPPGYVDVTWVDMSRHQQDPTGYYAKKPWWARNAVFGAVIAYDLLLRIVAKFTPHLRMALIHQPWGDSLQPYDVRWGAPKCIVEEIERQKARDEKPAGEFWWLHWSSSYPPKFGYEKPEYKHSHPPKD